MTLEAGRVLGGYEIVAPAGRGGMGEVYKARKPSLDRYVALKVVPPRLAADPAFRQRFVVEALAIGRLRHPNVLGAIDFGEAEDIAFLISEFVDGGVLEEQLGQPLPREYVVRMLAPIASALDYAHTKGVVHRDVKPSNILVARDGTPYLTDFGLAAVAGSGPRLTESGAAVGTAEYMAPEEALGEPASAASDNYALAVVAYEMLTGHLPFQADVPVATLLAHAHRPVPPDERLSEPLFAALQRGLAKDPAARYPSASELIRAIDQAISVRASTEPAAAPPRRGGGRRRIVAGGLAALVAAVALVVVTQPSATPSDEVTETPAPADVAASPPHANPPKGKLVYAAKLARGADDLRLPRGINGDPAGSELRAGDGVIEMIVRAEGSGTSASFNMPSRTNYVGELDLAATPGSSAVMTLRLRLRQSDGSAYLLAYDPARGVELLYYDAARGETESLTSLAPVPGARSGRTFTLAAVVSGQRITVFVDEREVLAVTDDRITSASIPEISWDGSSGTLRITGARFYEVRVG